MLVWLETANNNKGPARFTHRASTAYGLLFFVLERVANGHAVPIHARSGEFNVVVHEVKMSFGADKDVVGHIQANSAAYVSEEMVAAVEISAAERRALKERLVEAQTLKSNSALKIQLCPLPQLRSINGIEVEKNRTVGLKELVDILMGPPCDFRAYSEILLEQKVAAERRISAAADALILMVDAISIACRIAGYGAVPKSQIHLLSMGCAGSNKNKKTKSRDYER